MQCNIQSSVRRMVRIFEVETRFSEEPLVDARRLLNMHI